MRAFTLSRACTATRDAASLEASAPLRLGHTEESWEGWLAHQVRPELGLDNAVAAVRPHHLAQDTPRLRTRAGPGMSEAQAARGRRHARLRCQRCCAATEHARARVSAHRALLALGALLRDLALVHVSHALQYKQTTTTRLRHTPHSAVAGAHRPCEAAASVAPKWPGRKHTLPM